MSGRRIRPEDEIQRAVAQLLSLYEFQGKILWFAIPNGGHRRKIEAAILKSLGVRAGVPDICICFQNGPTVFIELKAEKGRVSPDQEKWIGALNHSGLHRHAFVCRSVYEVHEIVKRFIKASS